jgi:general secretion pathway protein A
MYKEHWQLERYPFENTPDPAFFYLSPSHREALAWVSYGIQERKGAIVLTGDVGCGKTVLSRKIVRDLPPDRFDVAAVVNPSLSPVELLREILHQLGVTPRGRSKVDLLHSLNAALIHNHEHGKHTVILIDEAQAIRNAATLEELRLLLNFQLNDAYLLTLVLIGQPEWTERLAELPQLDQRVSVRYNLRPLAAEETAGYVAHRIRMAGARREIFRPAALAAIHAVTRGIPRRINTLCDRCLLAGYRSGATTVDEELVRGLAAG